MAGFRVGVAAAVALALASAPAIDSEAQPANRLEELKQEGGTLAEFIEAGASREDLLGLSTEKLRDDAPPAPPGEPGATADIEYSRETQLDTRDPEVEAIAAIYGLSREEALAIANWQSVTAPLVEDLYVAFADSLAEVRLHIGGDPDDPTLPRGQLHLAVATVDDEDGALDSALVEIMNAGEPELVGLVSASYQIVRAPKTFLQLEQAVQNDPVFQERGELATRVEITAATGEVVVTPVEPFVLRHNGTNCSASFNLQYGSLDGARGISKRHFNSTSFPCTSHDLCTSGFAAYMAMPGGQQSRYGVTTAGHCLDDYLESNGFVNNRSTFDLSLNYISNNASWYASVEPYWYCDVSILGAPVCDAGFISRQYDNTTYPGRIYKHDTGEWRETASYSYVSRAKGYMLCVSASAMATNGAGTYCGKVTDISGAFTEIDTHVGGLGCGATPCAFFSGETPGSGGSGGPAFWTTRVYGIYFASDITERYGQIMKAGGVEDFMHNDTVWHYFICHDGVGNGTLCDTD